MDKQAIEKKRSELQQLKGNPEEINKLMEGFKDSSWRVRKTALEIALERFNAKDIIEPLIKLLYLEDNAGARNTAIEALVRLGKLAVPYLARAFSTDNKDVRKFIIDVLGSIGGTETVDVLIEALKDADNNVKASAVEYLGRLGEKSVVHELLKILEGNDLWTAYPAIDAIARIGDERAIPYLIKTLENRALTEPSIRALSFFADPSVLKAIVPYLKDQRRSIQEEAIKAIERFYQKGISEEFISETILTTLGTEAFDLIKRHLESNSNDVRNASVLLLGILKDTRAVKPLLDLSEDESLSPVVKRSLLYITKAYPEILLDYLKEVETTKRRLITEILAETKDKRYYKTLSELIKDRDGHVISNAAKGLGFIGDRSSVEILFNLFSHPYPDVQIAAVEALSNLKKYIQEEEIIQRLGSDDDRVRKNAALLAGNILSTEVLDELGFLLKDPSEDVRMAALLAIFKICKRNDIPGCMKYIKIALSDESPQIRARATLGLAEFKQPEAMELSLIMAEDSNDHVRAAAANTLGQFKTEKSLKKLINLLGDSNGLVVTRAIESLSGFTDTAARDAIARMVNSKDEEIKRTAILSLAGFENSESIIAKFLSSSDWATRLAAVQALASINSDVARSFLEEILDSETDPLVKEAIEGALGV